MSGIEQFPGVERPRVYGFDAEKGEVFPKKAVVPDKTKKHPAYKRHPRSGELTEIKDADKGDKPWYSSRILKAIALGAALTAGVVVGMKESAHEPEKNSVAANADTGHKASKQASALAEQTALKAEEEKLTWEKFFSPLKKEVVLDNTKEKELVDIWMNKYRTNPKLRNSLVAGFKEMGKWQLYLEQIFKEEGVPTEYMYLALAESHWQPNAVSRTGATGPYQFMPKTARLYDLTIGNGLNECKDPLRSARACAQLLHDLHEACGDWNLALAGYNGGHLWRYIKVCKASGEKMSHESFLKYLEGEINNVKNGLEGKDFKVDIVHNNKNVAYWANIYHLKPSRLCSMIGIASGSKTIPDHIKSINIRGKRHKLEIDHHNDELKELAKKYRLGPNRLCQIAGIPENSRHLPENIKSIVIPMAQLTEVQRHKLLDGHVRDLNENKQYPAKGIAINNLIKEGEVTAQQPTIKFKEVVIKQPKTDTPEAIKKIAKKKRRKQQPAGYISLTVVARNHGNTLKEISELNPGLELGARIPDGYVVRVRG